MNINIIKVADLFPRLDPVSPMLKMSSNGNHVWISFLLDTEEEIEVKFLNCLAYKFESINDQVFYGHPFYTKISGFGNMTYIIENSNWLNEIRSIHKIHPYFNEERWNNYTHYFFALKEHIIEIICQSYEITK